MEQPPPKPRAGPLTNGTSAPEAAAIHEGEVSPRAHRFASEGLAAVWVDPHTGAELPLFDGVAPPPADDGDSEGMDSIDGSSLEDGSLEGSGGTEEPTHEESEGGDGSQKSSSSRLVPSLRTLGRMTIFANKTTAGKGKAEGFVEGRGNALAIDSRRTGTDNNAAPPTKGAAADGAAARKGAAPGQGAGTKGLHWGSSLIGSKKAAPNASTSLLGPPANEPQAPAILGPSELCVVVVEARALVHPDRARRQATGGSADPAEDQLVSCSVVLQCNDQV